jgi:hypothetical protein
MAKIPLEYLDHIPRKLPLNRTLVHNRVDAQWENHPPGLNGFRAWTVTRLQVSRDKRYQKCTCGWSGLPHYRVATPGDEPPSVKGKRFTEGI